MTIRSYPWHHSNQNLYAKHKKSVAIGRLFVAALHKEQNAPHIASDTHGYDDDGDDNSDIIREFERLRAARDL